MLVAADDDAQRALEHLLRFRSPLPVEIVRDAREALRDADAAAVASGTAVLEAALLEVPTLALYVLSEAQAKIARRVYRGRTSRCRTSCSTSRSCPSCCKKPRRRSARRRAAARCSPQPARQRDGYARLRAALGPPDALQRYADWVLAARRSARR